MNIIYLVRVTDYDYLLESEKGFVLHKFYCRYETEAELVANIWLSSFTGLATIKPIDRRKNEIKKKL
jgi:hypothetical protein